jgi:hypothetical protein
LKPEISIAGVEWHAECNDFVKPRPDHPDPMQKPINLTEAEREWLSKQRARPCRHGHLRHDARLYRNAAGCLWLDCIQCVRDRVNAYRRRMVSLTAQAR